MAVDCTATLVGSHSVLTAAHCVAPDRVGDHYRVYFQHAGVLPVSSVQYPRELYRHPTADVAIVHLRDEVAGITPIPINTAAEILTGTSGLLVGFGPTASTAGDAGLKRIGLTTTAACDCPAGSTDSCTPPDSLVPQGF